MIKPTSIFDDEDLQNAVQHWLDQGQTDLRINVYAQDDLNKPVFVFDHLWLIEKQSNWIKIFSNLHRALRRNISTEIFTYPKDLKRPSSSLGIWA